MTSQTLKKKKTKYYNDEIHIEFDAPWTLKNACYRDYLLKVIQEVITDMHGKNLFINGKGYGF